jgi:hypothetical protein
MGISEEIVGNRNGNVNAKLIIGCNGERMLAKCLPKTIFPEGYYFLGGVYL